MIPVRLEASMQTGQQRRIRSSVDERDMTAWERYSSHRAHVMSALHPILEAAARIAILGCGENNDLDLRNLSDRSTEIHLVDIDAQAVSTGVRRQMGADHGGIVEHTPVDLAGAIVTPGAPLAGLASSMDAVVSTCVLSQLVDQAEHTPAASAAIRRQHIDNILDLLRPGGWGVLLTDFTSDLTTPAIRYGGPPLDEALLTSLVANGNFFAGLNPFSVLDDLRSRTQLGSLVGLGPWVWRQAADRTYLVVGFRFQKRKDAL